MLELDYYLKNLQPKMIPLSFYESYSEYDYATKENFALAVNYLCQEYGIKVITSREVRLTQEEFRRQLVELYGKCVATGQPVVECEAAHIIPVCEGGGYTVSNGLLLTASIHKTFDRQLWCIHPETLEVITKEETEVGTISRYAGKKLDLRITDELLCNLTQRYQNFSKN